MRKRTLCTLTALACITACSNSVDAICEEALQDFYDCGGAPQAYDMDACIDRYETAPYGCDDAFNARLECTYGLSCDEEDSVCAGALSDENNACDGDPIVPPY